jgi:hypothetical protein
MQMPDLPPPDMKEHLKPLPCPSTLTPGQEPTSCLICRAMESVAMSLV